MSRPCRASLPVARQVVGDRRAGSIVEFLACFFVDLRGDRHLVGHELVEAHVDRPLRADDLAVADQCAEHQGEAGDPRRRNLVHRDRRTVHPRGVGDHREHREATGAGRDA